MSKNVSFVERGLDITIFVQIILFGGPKMTQPIDVAFVLTSVILGYVIATVVLAAVLHIVFNNK